MLNSILFISVVARLPPLHKNQRLESALGRYTYCSSTLSTYVRIKSIEGKMMSDIDVVVRYVQDLNHVYNYRLGILKSQNPYINESIIERKYKFTNLKR